MLKDSNWCPEVYRSLFIDKHNNDHVRVAPCCQAESDIEPADTFDFVSSPYLNQYRQQFDRNERAPGCHRCWQAEDVGLCSRRQSAIEFYNMPVNRTVLLEGLDHSATWACNLACIMCSPFSSSTWATEMALTEKELHQIGRRFPKYNSYLNRLDLTNVKKLHFNGGEPLLNNKHVDLMSKLAEQGDFSQVLLSYNTNGTTMPSAKTVDMWSRARAVRIYFSIDATNSAFEYIRYPAKWEEVANNMIRMRDELPSNVMFGINTTVGFYNVFEAVDVLRWFKENLATNREGDASDFNWQSVRGYHIKYLPERAIIAATEYINTAPELSSLATYVHSERDKSNAWIAHLDHLDQRRGTNWRQTLKIGQSY